MINHYAVVDNGVMHAGIARRYRPTLLGTCRTQLRQLEASERSRHTHAHTHGVDIIVETNVGHHVIAGVIRTCLYALNENQRLMNNRACAYGPVRQLEQDMQVPRPVS